MIFSEFKNLSRTERELLIWSRGVIIAQLDNKQSNTVLFQLDGFYAEITYHCQSKFIREIFCFDSLEFLDPYLSSINIEPLYEH